LLPALFIRCKLYLPTFLGLYTFAAGTIHSLQASFLNLHYSSSSFSSSFFIIIFHHHLSSSFFIIIFHHHFSSSFFSFVSYRSSLSLAMDVQAKTEGPTRCLSNGWGIWYTFLAAPLPGTRLVGPD